jgi:hypothetical protein
MRLWEVLTEAIEVDSGGGLRLVEPTARRAVLVVQDEILVQETIARYLRPHAVTVDVTAKSH